MKYFRDEMWILQLLLYKRAAEFEITKLYSFLTQLWRIQTLS